MNTEEKEKKPKSKTIEKEKKALVNERKKERN